MQYWTKFIPDNDGDVATLAAVFFRSILRSEISPMPGAVPSKLQER